MSDTTGLWDAVDALTKPTTMRIDRDEHAAVDLAADLLHDLATNPRRTRCSVAEYRRATGHLTTGQVSGHGKIPSLWDQAESAVATGREQQGGSGSSPLRERSPADLELMEALLTVRELVADELRKRHRAPRLNLPAQLRQVASEIVATDDETLIRFWTLRIEQWSRILGSRLDAVDNGPKPVRLRDSPCPRCLARQIRVLEQGETRMVPPIRIDFDHGWIRAATCGGCGAAWFRGDSLHELSDALQASVLAEGA